MCHSQAEILRQEASVTKQSCPQLDTNDAEDEEDEEAEQQDVAQHGQRVQQQRDEDAHACGGRSHAGGARPSQVARRLVRWLTCELPPLSGGCCLGGSCLHPIFLPNFREIADWSWQGGVGVGGIYSTSIMEIYLLLFKNSVVNNFYCMF